MFLMLIKVLLPGFMPEALRGSEDRDRDRVKVARSGVGLLSLPRLNSVLFWQFAQHSLFTFGTLCHHNNHPTHHHRPALPLVRFLCLRFLVVCDVAELTESPRLAPGGRFFVRRRDEFFFFLLSFCMRSALSLFASRPYLQNPRIARRLLWNTVFYPSLWIQTSTPSLATTKTIQMPTLQRWYVCCILPFTRISTSVAI